VGNTMLRFVVRDTGPGVPPEAVERIFAEFEQAEQSPARRLGGTGLGLAISKRLVDAMDGRIAVASAPGSGATFTVDLPLAIPPQAVSLGSCWPKPAVGEKVLLVLNGAVEAGLFSDLTQANGFDIGLMDIHMPDMDGIEAARRIRALYPDGARPAEGRPPIVVLTANSFDEDRAAYLEAGLDDYLAKPFEKADLAALLTRWGGFGDQLEERAGRGAA
jgi:CheY-like chemotaxis protein